MSDEFDAAVAMTHVSRRVARDLAGTLSYETVQREVVADYERITGDASVRQFVPVLVERAVRDRIRTTLRGRSAHVSNLVFVCTRNAGRSQMAAAFARRHSHGRLTVRSAGSEPSDSIHAEVTRVMAEVGIDLRGESPAQLTETLLDEAHAVVTMGCGDAVPVRSGVLYLDWDVEDPFGRSVDEVRKIRDEIERRTHHLLHDLLSRARAV